MLHGIVITNEKTVTLTTNLLKISLCLNKMSVKFGKAALLLCYIVMKRTKRLIFVRF